MKLEEAKTVAANLAGQSVDCVQRIAASQSGAVMLDEAKLLRELGSGLTVCALEIQARLYGKPEPKIGD